MRILIAYASKNGAARTCVERLEASLRGAQIKVVDLEREQPDPVAFDLVVFGSSVYFGKLRPAARRFLKTYAAILAQKKLFLFLCCGISREHEHYLETLFPRELRSAALQILYFGGLLRTEGLSLPDKLLVRAIRSSIFEEDMDNGEYMPTLPSILPENIDRMSTYIRAEIAKAL